MKVELDRDEVRAALQQHIASLLGGDWICIAEDYELPRRVEFEKDTPERRAEKAREEEEAAKRRAERKISDLPGVAAETKMIGQAA